MLVNRNLNNRIRQALYILKRMYGGTIYLAKKDQVSTDYETGKKTSDEHTWKIDRAIVLPVNVTREANQTISMISANKQFVYGGTYDIGARLFVLDARDLPKDFTIETDDWLVYENKRYSIKTRTELEQKTGWMIMAREVEGVNTPVIFVNQHVDLANEATATL